MRFDAPNLLMRSGSCRTVLWIHPPQGVERRWLLTWHGPSASLALPTIPGRYADAAALRHAVTQTWGPDFAAALQWADRPLGRLPVTSQGDAPAHGEFLHAAVAVEEQVPPATDSFRGEWVSLKDIAIGFTAAGREIDPQVRRMLETTGRLPRRDIDDPADLTIGVTGHRLLPAEDLPVLYDKLHEAVLDIEREFPRRPIRMLSPLAEGADQLLADVALERGFPLEAPLPKPLDQYEREFTTPQALDEFRATLERAASWYTLPDPPYGSAVMPTAGTGLAVDTRHAPYVQVGRYVVDASDILLTLRDGRATTSPGGTADVLRYALQTPRRPSRRLLIRHIPTRRTR